MRTHTHTCQNMNFWPWDHSRLYIVPSIRAKHETSHYIWLTEFFRKGRNKVKKKEKGKGSRLLWMNGVSKKILRLLKNKKRQRTRTCRTSTLYMHGLVYEVPFFLNLKKGLLVGARCIYLSLYTIPHGSSFYICKLPTNRRSIILLLCASRRCWPQESLRRRKMQFRLNWRNRFRMLHCVHSAWFVNVSGSKSNER